MSNDIRTHPSRVVLCLIEQFGHEEYTSKTMSDLMMMLLPNDDDNDDDDENHSQTI